MNKTKKERTNDGQKSDEMKEKSREGKEKSREDCNNVKERRKKRKK